MDRGEDDMGLDGGPIDDSGVPGSPAGSLDALDAPDPARLRASPTPASERTSRRALLGRPQGSLPPLGSPLALVSSLFRPSGRPAQPADPLDLLPPPSATSAPTLVPDEYFSVPGSQPGELGEERDEDVDFVVVRRSPWPFLALGAAAVLFALCAGVGSAVLWRFSPEPRVYEARVGTPLEVPPSPPVIEAATTPVEIATEPARVVPRPPEAAPPRKAQVRGERTPGETRDRPRSPTIRLKPKNAAVRPKSPPPEEVDPSRG